MSFRDDFNNLDLNVWEVVNHIGEKASVGISDGKLRLAVTDLDERGWFGILRKSRVNLLNKSIEVTLDFEYETTYGPTFKFGVLFSNKPLENQRTDPDFHGIFFGLIGEARRRPIILRMSEYLYPSKEVIMTTTPKRIPTILRLKVGEKAVYLCEVVDGKEWNLFSYILNFDISNLYFYIYAYVVPSEAAETKSGAVLVDYVDVKEAPVSETAQETVSKALVSLTATIFYTMLPLTLFLLTVREIRRVIKKEEAEAGG